MWILYVIITLNVELYSASIEVPIQMFETRQECRLKALKASIKDTDKNVAYKCREAI